MEDKITVIKGKIEEVQLPVPSVDIIIADWMGHFLLYRSKLDSILWARDHYLAPGGKMLPDRAQLYIAAIEDHNYSNEIQAFWSNVHGVNMSCIAPTVMLEPLRAPFDSANIISETCKVFDIDLLHCSKEDINFATQYTLKIRYTDKIHGLVGWFDVLFSEL